MGEKKYFKTVTKSPAGIQDLHNYIWAASLPDLQTYFSPMEFLPQNIKKIWSATSGDKYLMSSYKV